MLPFVIIIGIWIFIMRKMSAGGSGGGGGGCGNRPNNSQNAGSGGSGLVQVQYPGGSRGSGGNYWGGITYHIYYGGNTLTTYC